MRISPHLVPLSVLTVALCGCAPKQAAVVELKGECSDLYKTQFCTWARMQGPTVVEAGATVPIASIEGAPAQEAMAWPPVSAAAAMMPDSARAGSGMTNVTVYWEATGHPPGVYMTPHFDVHFNLVSAAELAAIDCTDRTKPTALPAAYMLPDVPLPPPVAKMFGVDTLVGLCVPHMGMHAALASDVASTAVFDGTMIIGYYKGKPVFVEPMLSRAMLMKKQSFDLPVPTIPGMTGVYPRTFHAVYDTDQQAYRFAFSGFAAGA